MNRRIALDPQRCTSCIICARECPAWAISIASHPESTGVAAGRRERTQAVLDSFVIDFGTCLYCGICVEECPFDALSFVEAPMGLVAGREDLRLGIDELTLE